MKDNQIADDGLDVIPAIDERQPSEIPQCR